VITREGSTPALVRALRAGTLDLALLASAPPFRPPDTETPALELQDAHGTKSLRVALPAAHPLARDEFVDVADLHGQRWVAGSGEDQVMGVWPGLDERPEIAHTARDWLGQTPPRRRRLRHHHRARRTRAPVPPGVRILRSEAGRKNSARILPRATPAAAIRARRPPRRRAPRRRDRERTRRCRRGPARVCVFMRGTTMTTGT